MAPKVSIDGAMRLFSWTRCGGWGGVAGLSRLSLSSSLPLGVVLTGGCNGSREDVRYKRKNYNACICTSRC